MPRKHPAQPMPQLLLAIHHPPRLCPPSQPAHLCSTWRWCTYCTPTSHRPLKNQPCPNSCSPSVHPPTCAARGGGAGTAPPVPPAGSSSTPGAPTESPRFRASCCMQAGKYAGKQGPAQAESAGWAHGFAYTQLPQHELIPPHIPLAPHLRKVPQILRHSLPPSHATPGLAWPAWPHHTPTSNAPTPIASPTPDEGASLSPPNVLPHKLQPMPCPTRLCHARNTTPLAPSLPPPDEGAQVPSIHQLRHHTQLVIVAERLVVGDDVGVVQGGQQPAAGRRGGMEAGRAAAEV